MSVSTASCVNCIEIEDKNADWGWLQWIQDQRLIDVMFDGSVQLAHFECHQLLGPNYHRIDPCMSRPVRLDSSRDFEFLRIVAESFDLSKAHEYIQSNFLNHQSAARFLSWVHSTPPKPDVEDTDFVMVPDHESLSEEMMLNPCPANPHSQSGCTIS
eukprot:TRINITY_DN20245_c0_g1_i1.p1 TRINITY_DN20245_c0_g1~~TRINITY_DN20245_c0_g1_i1.p1  ORF type:complete len:157 (-),score=12.81 TRINITY_DN20245_c0_g1_i1:44-514(-)